MRIIYICFIIILISFPARGSHIVGGDFSLTHIGNDQYELTFQIFRDCIHAQVEFNDPVTVGMFERGTHNAADTLIMHKQERIDLSFSDEHCVEEIPDICNEIGYYSKTIHLDPDEFDHPEGYYFSWERCCRNIVTDNVRLTRPNSGPGGSEAIAFYMEVPPLDKQASTPAFDQNPMTLLCVNNYYELDFSVHDPDNDSIAYSLIEPIKGNLGPNQPNHWTENGYPYVYSGPYHPIIWENGYSLNNIMNSDPPIHIDPNSGILRVTPTQTGLYALAIEAEFFRDGEQLGRVVRELQFTVTSCLDNRPPELSEEVRRDTTIELYATDVLDLPVIADDPDEGDSVFMYFEGDVLDPKTNIPLPNPIAEADSGLNYAESNIYWETNCEHIRDEPYTIRVNAEDNGCPQSMHVVEEINIKVLPPPEAQPPGVICLERIDANSKFINWQDYPAYKQYKDYLSAFSLVKVTPDGEEILTTFTDTSENAYIDNNAPVNISEEQCYFLRAENVCGDVVNMGYDICSEEELEQIGAVTIHNTTVINNEHVKVSWEKSDEKQFQAYHLYRKERNSDEPFQWHTNINNIDSTTFIDTEVDVDETSYCYRIQVSNSCGLSGEESHRGCQIVLDGISNPFVHELNWMPYKYWKSGINRYEVWRTFPGEDPKLVANIDPNREMEWLDDEMPYDEGAYFYRITAVNEGNKSTESHSNEIFLYQEPKLHVPNAFSPNDDQTNDLWKYKPVYVRDFHLQIYTRWGELVYETTDMEDLWDGKINGEISEETVFVYKIRYKGWDERSRTEQGTISVVR